MSDNNLIEIEQTQTQAVATQTQDQYLNLITVAVEKGADVTQLEKLMDLQDRFEAKQAKKAFYESLSKFQAEIPVIKKRGKASFDTRAGKTEYTFAKLEHIVSDIKPYLLANNLSFRFEQSNGENGLIKITCVVSHCLGHSESNSMEAAPDTSGGKNNIQQHASTVTYLQRYTLTGALGIVVQDEDADGGKHGLAISDELTAFVTGEISKGLNSKAIINGLIEQYEVSQAVKEHVVDIEVTKRIETMCATLAVNNNEQSINHATNSYNTEIMDMCRVATLDPSKYLGQVRNAAMQAIERISS